MINLLPDKQKKLLVAARTNTLLIRYNLILGAGVMFLALAVVIVYVFLTTMQVGAEQTIASNQAREQTYAEVKTRAEQLQTEINGAKSIFDNEISYSKALIRYADLFPKGTAISSMKLDENSFGQSQSLTVKVTGEQATKDLIDSMKKSPYVRDFHRSNISVNSEGGKYPYTVDVTFSLTKEIAK